MPKTQYLCGFTSLCRSDKNVELFFAVFWVFFRLQSTNLSGVNLLILLKNWLDKNVEKVEQINHKTKLKPLPCGNLSRYRSLSDLLQFCRRRQRKKSVFPVCRLRQMFVFSMSSLIEIFVLHHNV